MITHHKFEIDVCDGAQPLHLKALAGREHFHFQSINGHKKLTLWCQINTDIKESRLYKFYVFGTGHDIQRDADAPISKLKFLSTVVGPVYVWHVYREYFTEELKS